jgi:M6 family metalloprotease-like protein
MRTRPFAAALLIASHTLTPAALAQAERAGCPQTLNPLVIQVEFPDVPRRIDSGFVRRNFLEAPDRYLREMSYGKVCISGKLTPRWYRLPASVDAYFVPWQNLKVDKGKLRRLVTDTLSAVERDIDVTQHDFVMVVLAATAREWGNQGLNTYPGLLGWADDSALLTPSGRKMKGGMAVYAQTANLGKVVHNVAHVLGGVRDGRRVLPDMYDQSLASASAEKAGPAARAAYIRSQIHMGAWDPMSCNMCLQRPGIPGFSAWTRLRLGWIEDHKVRTIAPGERTEVRLDPLASPEGTTLAIRIPLTATTSYLIENRQPVGQDRHAPAAGILIMLADDSIPEPRFGRAPVRLINANPTDPTLNAAAFDLSGQATFTDAVHRVEVRLVRKEGRVYVIAVARGT